MNAGLNSIELKKQALMRRINKSRRSLICALGLYAKTVNGRFTCDILNSRVYFVCIY